MLHTINDGVAGTSVGMVLMLRVGVVTPAHAHRLVNTLYRIHPIPTLVPATPSFIV